MLVKCRHANHIQSVLHGDDKHNTGKGHTYICLAACHDRSAYDSTRKLSRMLWLAFAVLLVLFTALAFFSHAPEEPELRIFSGAQRMARFYQPWLLIVFPLWGSGLKRVMLKNEVKEPGR